MSTHPEAAAFRRPRRLAGAAVSALLAAPLLAACTSAPAWTSGHTERAHAPDSGATANSVSFHAAARAGEQVAEGRRAHARGPNILMITTDDESILDLRFMPHLRKQVARRGVTFTDSLAPTPLCAPARASLLSGQYAHNHGTHSISGPHGGFHSFRDRNTLPVWLHRAGYTTSFAGKYLNGYGDTRRSRRYVPPGWDQWRATVGKSTYNFARPVININGKRPERHHEYNTRLFSSFTRSFIERQQHRRKPWFAWINYVAPHHGGPHHRDDPVRKFRGTGAAFHTTVPDPRDRDHYRGIRLPDRPDMFDRHTADVPRRSPARNRFNKRQRRAIRTVYQRRAEAVRGVDRAIGQTVRSLKRTGQWNRTVLIFTSDNGYATGEHNYVGKLWHYNEIVRVPMLMTGPGIPHRRVHTTITNADIPVTIAALAGARPKHNVDGINLLPLLRGPTKRRVIPLESWPVTNGAKARLLSGLRYGPWTYVRLRHGQELYDRRTDPYELHNLAHHHEPGTRATRMLHRLRQATPTYLHCRAKSCRKPLP